MIEQLNYDLARAHAAELIRDAERATPRAGPGTPAAQIPNSEATDLFLLDACHGRNQLMFRHVNLLT